MTTVVIVYRHTCKRRGYFTREVGAGGRFGAKVLDELRKELHTAPKKRAGHVMWLRIGDDWLWDGRYA